jgi:hypothetical protein
MKTLSVAPFLPLVLLVILVLTAPALLLALAYASPPDPSWISGIYDDADYDDVVTLVTSATGHVAPAAPADDGRLGSPAEHVPPLIENVEVTPSLFSSAPRAPPVCR